MAGSSTLLSNLVDKLVPEAVDGVRDKLHRKLGVRPYLMHTVLRTWTGRAAGSGSFTDQVLEIRPEPKVHVWDGYRYQLETCGLDDMGEIKLSEVSLTYTFAELTGGKTLGQNQQFFIRLSEAHGQEDCDRYYTHSRVPYKDRENTIGWILWLKASEA